MLPGHRPQQPAVSGEQPGTPALPAADALGRLAGVMPWQRPVVDVMDGTVLGHDLSYPPDFVRPQVREQDYGQDQFVQDFARQREWLAAAQRAGLAAPGRWLVLPVNARLAGRHPETLARLLAEARADVQGGPLSAVRVAIQFEAALHATDAGASLALIGVFRAQGLAIAINGFGDGFESRQDLLDAAPDLLRLSPSLTRGLQDDRHRRSIVSALAGMAQELGIGLIADEVDSAALAARLLALGVRVQTGPAHGALAPLGPQTQRLRR